MSAAPGSSARFESEKPASPPARVRHDEPISAFTSVTTSWRSCDVHADADAAAAGSAAAGRSRNDVLRSTCCAPPRTGTKPGAAAGSPAQRGQIPAASAEQSATQPRIQQPRIQAGAMDSRGQRQGAVWAVP